MLQLPPAVLVALMMTVGRVPLGAVDRDVQAVGGAGGIGRVAPVALPAGRAVLPGTGTGRAALASGGAPALLGGGARALGRGGALLRGRTGARARGRIGGGPGVVGAACGGGEHSRSGDGEEGEGATGATDVHTVFLTELNRKVEQEVLRSGARWMAVADMTGTRRATADGAGHLPTAVDHGISLAGGRQRPQSSPDHWGCRNTKRRSDLGKRKSPGTLSWDTEQRSGRATARRSGDPRAVGTC